jgi:hypothetical protein
VPSREHVEVPVTYAQIPPVGGDHAPVWQNCGYYDHPITNENGVHSLEHGVVWITYDPSLGDDAVATLRDLAKSQSHVLVSQYEGLPSPIVASAWGVRLELQSITDPRLNEFVAAYRKGKQAPEPGASCTGGIGEPLR